MAGTNPIPEEWFIGHESANCDDKGRVHIPTEYAAIGKKLVLMTAWKAGIVAIFRNDQDELKKTLGPLEENMPFLHRLTLNEEGEDRRIAFGIAIAKKFNFLSSEVIFVGRGTYLELWLKTQWDAYFHETITRAKGHENAPPSV